MGFSPRGASAAEAARFIAALKRCSTQNQNQSKIKISLTAVLRIRIRREIPESARVRATEIQTDPLPRSLPSDIRSALGEDFRGDARFSTIHGNLGHYPSADQDYISLGSSYRTPIQLRNLSFCTNRDQQESPIRNN